MPTSSVCEGIVTTRANILRPATQPAGMDFTGTWKVYSEENLEAFLKEVGKTRLESKKNDLPVDVQHF